MKPCRKKRIPPHELDSWYSESSWTRLHECFTGRPNIYGFVPPLLHFYQTFPVKPNFYALQVEIKPKKLIITAPEKTMSCACCMAFTQKSTALDVFWPAGPGAGFVHPGKSSVVASCDHFFGAQNGYQLLQQPFELIWFFEALWPKTSSTWFAIALHVLDHLAAVGRNGNKTGPGGSTFAAAIEQMAISGMLNLETTSVTQVFRGMGSEKSEVCLFLSSPFFSNQRPNQKELSKSQQNTSDQWQI